MWDYLNIQPSPSSEKAGDFARVFAYFARISRCTKVAVTKPPVTKFQSQDPHRDSMSRKVFCCEVKSLVLLEAIFCFLLLLPFFSKYDFFFLYPFLPFFMIRYLQRQTCFLKDSSTGKPSYFLQRFSATKGQMRTRVLVFAFFSEVCIRCSVEKMDPHVEKNTKTNSVVLNYLSGNLAFNRSWF